MTAGAGEPRFTVVIPAFNAAATVGRAVASARRLPGVDAVLVIDDGSADDSPAIAAAAGAAVVRQANAGPGAARNAALDRADPATHALFLDADDELLDGATGAIAAALLRSPDAAGVIGGHTQLAGDRRAERTPEEAWVAAGALPNAAAALGPSHVFCTSGFTLTRRGIDAGIRFDPSLHFAEDRDLICRAARVGPIAVTGATLLLKHAGPLRMTADPARVSRWLRDQVALTRRHLPGADGATRENLARSLEWVFKHAARTLASRGLVLDPDLWSSASGALAELGRPVPSAARRARVVARVRRTLRL